jgi:hypothetical protein
MVTRIEARRAEIASRYKKKRGPANLGAIRIAELRRIFRARHRGDTLSNDDAGREDAVTMAHHIAGQPVDAARRIRAWLELRAPWMTPGDVADLVDEVLVQPKRWTADELAARLNLTDAERQRLRIRSIGASDMTKAERQEARRDRARASKQRKRRAAGVVPRAEYLARCTAARTRPWEILGISQRT